MRKIWGVGRVAAGKLERLGIRTCGQVEHYSRIELHELFGKFGIELYDLCRGIDARPVEPHRERKSLSTERTYSDNLTTLSECEERLAELHEELLRDLARHPDRRPVHKLFLKLRFADFSRTTAECIGDRPVLDRYQTLLAEAYRRRDMSIRLMGVGVRFAVAAQADMQLSLAV